eukprot:CAMPEP_0115724854 /NCGR_PEP_ID=MMETSP0272-20121206/81001_1 /TAXON_ID=71861 /ORGANISM="Scrippsiella trochoidea, Strain CCMP3099" /LENGTH=530 /DNA_ID=CAMNT_0003168107 /DNA_START=8 /DNA_END=1601 /DNA_ORIENTATION=+
MQPQVVEEKVGSKSAQGAIGDSNQDQILKTLRHGQFALRKLRWVFGSLWLSYCIVCAWSTYLIFEAAEHWLPLRSNSLEMFVLDFLWESLFMARLVFPVLAPLDDGINFTRCVLVGEAAYFVFLAHVPVVVNKYHGLGLIAHYVTDYSFVACAVWVLIWRRTPQRLQRGFQQVVAVRAVLNILREAILVSTCPGTPLHRLAELPADLAVIYLMLWPQALQSVRARLRRWMEMRGATRAAAAIACLIGRAEAKEALQQARQSFRSVDVSQLTFEDVQDNAPDPRLHALAEPAQLGHCDAFVSHSWHDDAAAKWEALQEWRRCFRAKHKREPRVWFDKLCIDQNNIEADLRCLPVSLAGCSSLLILYGPTYLNRLWCIIEIFTYIMMGGSIEDIDVRLVLREQHAEEDKKSILVALESFDVANCQCYNPADKERILCVIDTAFGMLTAFNEVVAAALGRIQTESPVLAQITMTAGDNLDSHKCPCVGERRRVRYPRLAACLKAERAAYLAKVAVGAEGSRKVGLVLPCTAQI